MNKEKYIWQIYNLDNDSHRWARTFEMLITIVDEMVDNGTPLMAISIQPFLEEDHDVLISGDEVVADDNC